MRQLLAVERMEQREILILLHQKKAAKANASPANPAAFFPAPEVSCNLCVVSTTPFPLSFAKYKKEIQGEIYMPFREQDSFKMMKFLSFYF